MKKNNGITQIVQSHRGRQAIGHSMTYDPDVTMIDVRQKMLRRLEIMYLLALTDNSLDEKCDFKNCSVCNNNDTFCINKQPNIFWLGQIIHCIQDSYSRSHTLRFLQNSKHNMKGGSIPIINTFQYSKKELGTPSFKLVRNIGIILKNSKFNISNDNNIIELLLSNINDLEQRKLIMNNKKAVIHIFKISLFFKTHGENIRKLFKNNSRFLPSNANIYNHKSWYKNYPYLISFRYVEDQKKCGKLFHLKYDRQGENRLLEPYVIANCKYVLNMYKIHVKNLYR